MGSKKERKAQIRAAQELLEQHLAEAKAEKKRLKKLLKKGLSASSAAAVFGRDALGLTAQECSTKKHAVALHKIDTASTPGFSGTREEGEWALAQGAKELEDLQEQLFAASTLEDGVGSVLLVVQGMDTAGKGGITRHVVDAMFPQGVSLVAFKAPTEEEKKHDFLWRIRKHVPEDGRIVVFDRSHYEDVLIHRVHGWADEAELQRRYEAINEFEAELAARGTRVVKAMVHISPQEQGRRLADRLANPEKHWKYNPSDIDERKLWEDYQQAYSKAIEATDTEAAPWHIIPADHKWYARLAVQNLVLQALKDIAPQWPKAAFNVGAERARLAATMDEPVETSPQEG